MGLDEVHDEIEEAPFFEKSSRIVMVMFCRKCDSCGQKELCYECYKNGEKHYLGYPIYDENDYAEIFKKFYLAVTILTFVRSKSFVLKSVSCVTFFSEDWNQIFPRPLDEQY